jgi:hypothetical protein
MAAAIQAEKRHQSVPRGPSLLDGIRYELARGELDLFRFVESQTDEQVDSIVENAFTLGADSLVQVRAALTQDNLYTLLTFSRRRALSALRQGSSSPILAGFRALALVDLDRIDWRDAALAAGLLAYAGRQVGAAVQEVVSEIQERAVPAMGEVLARHAAAPEEGLGVGGFREIRTSQGVGLANDYGHSYAPSIELVSVAERVVSLIERDKYRVDNLTTGSDLPAIWLPTADAGATRARERLHGCLSVSARPKDDRRGMSDQMFSVWIAEAANGGDAQTIAAAATPKPGSDMAILGVASSLLCSVLVARSVVKGVRPLEDIGSLERFRPALQAAISLG